MTQITTGLEPIIANLRAMQPEMKAMTRALKRHAEPCKCAAYKFPHRAGSGKCIDPGEAPKNCGECMHSIEVKDPYSTGDGWYSIAECGAANCPWNK